MAVDHTGTAESGAEAPDKPTRPEPPPPPPDRPGAEDFPSRAESRTAASASDSGPEPNEQSHDNRDAAVSADTADQERDREAAPSGTDTTGYSAARSVESSEASVESTSEPVTQDRSDVAPALGESHADTTMGVSPPRGESAEQTRGETAFADVYDSEPSELPAEQRQPASADRSPHAERGSDNVQVAAQDRPSESVDLQTVPDDRADPSPGRAGATDTQHEPIQRDSESDGGRNGADTVDPIEGDDSGRRISGEGLLPDDNLRSADLDEDAVERGLSDRIRQVLATVDRTDQPNEAITTTVDQPDFQDPSEDPKHVPDRYGTPLDRADSTRTPLFDGEPTREQTQQGDLGDCGIVATLGAVAGHRPGAINACLRETDDGNYEVRLHEATFSESNMRYEPTGRSITLTVSPDLPVHESEPHKPAFADSASTGAAWAPVLEKAVAGIDQLWDDRRQLRATILWNARGNAGDAPTGYVRLNQGSNAGERAELLTQLTGQPAKTLEFPTSHDHRGNTPDQQLLDDVRKQLADDKPVLVGTRPRKQGEPPLPNRLAECHAYEVTKVDDHGKLHLRNPWNFRHPDPMTIQEFRANIRPRYTTLE